MLDENSLFYVILWPDFEVQISGNDGWVNVQSSFEVKIFGNDG
jgi:hypothetical protein